MLHMCFRYFTTNCKNSCKHATNASKQLQTACNYITNDCKHTSNVLAKHSECFIVAQCTSATNATNKSQILQVPSFKFATNALNKTLILQVTSIKFAINAPS